MPELLPDPNNPNGLRQARVADLVERGGKRLAGLIWQSLGGKTPSGRQIEPTKDFKANPNATSLDKATLIYWGVRLPDEVLDELEQSINDQT